MKKSTAKQTAVFMLWSCLAMQCGFSTDMLTSVPSETPSDEQGNTDDTAKEAVEGVDTASLSSGDSDEDGGDFTTDSKTEDDTEYTTTDEDTAVEPNPTDIANTDAVSTDSMSTDSMSTDDSITTDSIRIDSDLETDSESAGCSNDDIAPSEVLLIGDSWISLPGPRVGELARAAGMMDFEEDYVYRAVGGARILDIVDQYRNYLEYGSTPPRLVVMNGGAVDTYIALGSDESIAHVVDTFHQFLRRLADDGSIEHVIYVLYSEGSTIPGVVEMRPFMSDACAQSAVPCHFIDLQPIWQDHPEYTSMDTINPSSAGSDAIAAAIWQVMLDACMVQ